MDFENFAMESDTSDQISEIKSPNKYPTEDYITMTDSDFELEMNSDSDSDGKKSPCRDTDMKNLHASNGPLIDDVAKVEISTEEGETSKSSPSNPHQVQVSEDADGIPVESENDDESFDVKFSMVSIRDAKKVDKTNKPNSVHSLSKEAEVETEVAESKIAACKPCKVILYRIDGCVKPCSVVLNRNEVLAYKSTVPNDMGKKPNNKKDSYKKKLKSIGQSKTPRVILKAEEVAQYVSRNQNKNLNHVSSSPLEKQANKINNSKDNNIKSNIKAKQIFVKPISQYVSCKFCSRLFPTQKNMFFHVKMCHKPLNHCKFCRNKYISLTLLHSHVLNIHGVKPYCKICKEIFYSEYYLDQHCKTNCKNVKQL